MAAATTAQPGDCLHILYNKAYPFEEVAAEDVRQVVPIRTGNVHTPDYYYVHHSSGGAMVRDTLLAGISCCRISHTGKRCVHVCRLMRFLGRTSTKPSADRLQQAQNAASFRSATQAKYPDPSSVQQPSCWHHPATEEEKQAMHRLRQDPDAVLQTNGVAELCPPQPVGTCCHGGNFTKKQFRGCLTVYLKGAAPKRVPLCYWESSCRDLACCRTFDGYSKGMWITSSATAFAADFFYEYGTCFAASGMPQEAYVELQKDAASWLPEAERWVQVVC